MKKPFFTIVGEWPWQWFIYHTPAPDPIPPPPKPKPKQYRLVDWVAEDTGLSRGKARREIANGHVKVDDVVEMDADRMLLGSAKVELCAATAS